MSDGDTIVARATPPGRGGIAVVRVSGPAVRAIAAGMLGALPPPRRARLCEFRDGEGGLVDTGLALFFPAPRSFTGEDVLELHGHGGDVVSGLLVDAVLSHGARPAAPGEFSRRAYLNDKLDLSQAEAVADLIDSASAAAARAAQRSLAGEFSRAVHALTEAVTELRTWVEAAIDFPDEDIDFLDDAALAVRLDGVRARFTALEARARQGVLLRDGVHLVLAGRPNAGKSSLLNALAGYDAAIVTEVPGTTRDVVRERVELDGLPVHVVDTAGLRDAADAVEAEGVRRTRDELARADHALVIVDAAREDRDVVRGLCAELPAGLAVTVVRNKIDLTGEPAGPVDADPDEPSGGSAATVNVSARTGAGLDTLRIQLRRALGFAPPDEGTVIARRRHLEALARARAHFEAGCRVLAEQRAGDLMADDLREVQNALAEITGEFTSDDLLGRIFASFCLGK